VNRLARGIAAMSGIALASTVAVASPANAATCYDFNDETAPVVNSITVTPSSVELKPGLTSLVTVTVTVTDPIGLANCDYDGAYNDPYASGIWWIQTRIDLMTPQSGGYMTSDFEDATLASGTIYDGVWEAKYYLTDSYSLGNWSVDVTVVDNGINEQVRPDSGTFTTTKPSVVVSPPPIVSPTPTPAPAPTKATTYLTIDATPEPATLGETIKGKAKLRTAAGPLANRTVKFYFRAKGQTGWTYRSHDTTNSLGVALRKFTARKTGEWQARYAGSTTHLSDKAIDSVKVVR
jgi:hypothetical protein